MDITSRSFRNLSLKELLIRSVGNPAAEILAQKFRSPQEIYDAPFEEIVKALDSNPARATQFRAAVEIGRLIFLFPKEERPLIGPHGLRRQRIA